MLAAVRLRTRRAAPDRGYLGRHGRCVSSPKVTIGRMRRAPLRHIAQLGARGSNPCAIGCIVCVMTPRRDETQMHQPSLSTQRVMRMLTNTSRLVWCQRPYVSLHRAAGATSCGLGLLIESLSILMSGMERLCDTPT